MPFVDSNGVRIFYEAEGSGPAVVFLTGTGGDSRIWRYAGYLAGLPDYTSILMLTGEREDSDHHTERTVAAVPGARGVRIPGVGHLGAFARSDLALPYARPSLEKVLG